MITIIFYITTLLVAILGLTSFISMIISIPFNLIFKHQSNNLVLVNGFYFCWALIDFIWYKIEDGHIPLILLIGIIIVLFLQSKSKNHTKEGLDVLFSEIWALILILITIIILTFYKIRIY